MRTLLLLPALACGLVAEDLTLTAPIVRVRLHPDEAWVTRTGRARVEGAGVHRVRLGNLPAGLRLEDLQVSAKGPGGTRLGDVSVKAEVRTVAETPEWQRLEAERETLRDRRDALEAQRDSLQTEQKFLKELQATHSKELSGRLPYALPTAQSLADFGKGLQQRLAALMREERRATRDLAELAKAEQRVEAEMAQRQGQQRTAPSLVQVEVATASAGTVEVELSYRQTRARWRPVYEARLAEDRKTLSLVLNAAVTQKTGESWAGVAVEISNARPSRGLAFQSFAGPEVVTPGYQRLRESAGAPVAVSAQGFADGARSNTFAYSPAPPKPVAEAPMTVAEAPEATLQEEASGLAATWSLEGPKDIPSDGEAHRFRMLKRDLEPTLALVAVPRLEDRVQQVARFEAPGGFPLFPGAPVTHFAGTQRLGESQLELPAPRQPFELGFGPVKALRVALRKVDRTEETVGTFSKEHQWTLRDRIELANDGGTPLTVEVQDRVLKSEVDTLKIATLPDTTAGSTERIPGVRTWVVAVPAKGQGTVTVATTVRAPQGTELEGLD
jgi:uncharacterized protein (TIGR02231 family)